MSFRLLLLFAGLFFIAACESTPKLNYQFTRDSMVDYVQKNNFKALYIAIGENPEEWATGSSWEDPSVSRAKKSAFKKCENRKELFGVSAPCLLAYVGNFDVRSYSKEQISDIELFYTAVFAKDTVRTTVNLPSEYTYCRLRNETVSIRVEGECINPDTEITSDEFKATIFEADGINPNAIDTTTPADFYDYTRGSTYEYLRLGNFKAMYMSYGVKISSYWEGSWYWNTSTVKSATRQAYKYCEQRRKKAGLTTPCNQVYIGNFDVRGYTDSQISAVVKFYQESFTEDVLGNRRELPAEITYCEMYSKYVYIRVFGGCREPDTEISKEEFDEAMLPWTNPYLPN